MLAFLLIIGNMPLLSSGGKEQHCSVKVGFAQPRLRSVPIVGLELTIQLLIRSKISANFSETKVRLKLVAFENLLFTSLGSIFLKHQN